MREIGERGKIVKERGIKDKEEKCGEK